MTVTYAFLRVSTIRQDNEKFRYDILDHANRNNLGAVEFVEEVAYSKKDWRQRLIGELLVKRCEKGDVVLVPELSRISRSISQIHQICEYSQKKGVVLVFLKQNLTIGAENDLQTKIMLNTFALCAEIEISYIQERTREALRAKKAAGVRLGRPATGIGKSSLDKYAAEIVEMKANGASNAFLARRYEVAPLTVSNWIKKHPQLFERTCGLG